MSGRRGAGMWRCRYAEMQGCKGAGVSRCRGVEVQGDRDAEMKGCRSAGMPRCRDAEVQGCRGAEVSRCRGVEVQGCSLPAVPVLQAHCAGKKELPLCGGAAGGPLSLRGHLAPRAEMKGWAGGSAAATRSPLPLRSCCCYGVYCCWLSLGALHPAPCFFTWRTITQTLFASIVAFSQSFPPFCSLL